MDQVILNGPGGLRQTITSSNGHKETNGVVWSDADYLIYRVYFPNTAGRDLDIEASLIAPVQRTAGYCRGGHYPYSSMSYGGNLTADYAYWSGDNTGYGLESVLINVKKIKQDFPANQNIVMRFFAGWFGGPNSGVMAIKAEAYKGEMMVDPSDHFNWVPNTANGAYKGGGGTFPSRTTQKK